MSKAYLEKIKTLPEGVRRFDWWVEERIQELERVLSETKAWLDGPNACQEDLVRKYVSSWEKEREFLKKLLSEKRFLI